MKSIYFFILFALSCWNLSAIPMDEKEKPSQQKAIDLRNRTMISNAGTTDVLRGLISEMSITDDRSEAVQEAELAGAQAEQLSITEQARSLMPSFGFTEEEALNLYQCLKKLQQHQGPIDYLNSPSIVWDSIKQKFEEVEQDNNAAGVAVISDILKILNAYVDDENSKHRLDIFHVEQQDLNEPRLLTVLRSVEKNPQCCALQIAHDNREEMFQALPSTSSAAITAASHLQSPQYCLVFGFDVPDRKGPRVIFQKEFKKNFKNIVLKSVNNLNESLDISIAEQPFQRYLNFIIDTKKSGLSSRVTGAVSPQLQAWATFLEERRNKFDFSKKILSSLDEKARFLVKNYRHLNKKQPSALLHGANKDWNQVCDYLEPALTLLADVGTQLIAPDLNDQALEQTRLALEQRYQFSEPPITKKKQQDLQTVLDSVVMEAFFRRTSKLALEFARSQNMKIAFIWKMPPFYAATSAATTLEELHRYVEQKSYYQLHFRDNQYPKAITCSEIDHLTRLKKKNQAPDYLLIRDIILTTLSVSSSSLGKK